MTATSVRINHNGEKYGIKIPANSTMSFIYDLVNEYKTPRSFYITMKYEYTMDPAFKPADVLYLDVTGECGISYVPAVEGKFEFTNWGWTADLDGEFLGASGHTHDGGTMVTIKVNNKTNGPEPGLKHISDTGSCVLFGRFRKGDKIHILAAYDSAMHKLQTMHGRLEPLMGIALTYFKRT